MMERLLAEVEKLNIQSKNHVTSNLFLVLQAI